MIYEREPDGVRGLFWLAAILWTPVLVGAVLILAGIGSAIWWLLS